MLHAWPDFDADPFGDAEPGKKIGPEPDAAGASRDRDGSGLEQDLFEGLDSAHVGFRRSRPHRHADRCARQVEIRSRNDTPGDEQLVEALSGQDHHIGRHATGELRGNRMRPRALRRA